nr:uncharacterized protein LOC128697165 isoform X2 [Cherax quadricarinatus]
MTLAGNMERNESVVKVDTQECDDLRHWDPRVDDYIDLKNSRITTAGPGANFSRCNNLARCQEYVRESRGLFVNNVPSSLSSESLKMMFSEHGKVLSVFKKPSQDFVSSPVSWAIVKVATMRDAMSMIAALNSKSPLKLRVELALTEQERTMRHREREAEKKFQQEVEALTVRRISATDYYLNNPSVHLTSSTKCQPTGQDGEALSSLSVNPNERLLMNGQQEEVISASKHRTTCSFTSAPSVMPHQPSYSVTSAPSVMPHQPSYSVTSAPSVVPHQPSYSVTSAPSVMPHQPSYSVTSAPSVMPHQPSYSVTSAPSVMPHQPSYSVTSAPSVMPHQPSYSVTSAPSVMPHQPSYSVTSAPSVMPHQPSYSVTFAPSVVPHQPSYSVTSAPSVMPHQPSYSVTFAPSVVPHQPSYSVTSALSVVPHQPSYSVTSAPSVVPHQPSYSVTSAPSVVPHQPSYSVTSAPSVVPHQPRKDKCVVEMSQGSVCVEWKQPQPCRLCGKPGKLVCSVCKAWYCCKVCQVQHWHCHSNTCSPLPPHLPPPLPPPPPPPSLDTSVFISANSLSDNDRDKEKQHIQTDQILEEKNNLPINVNLRNGRQSSLCKQRTKCNEQVNIEQMEPQVSSVAVPERELEHNPTSLNNSPITKLNQMPSLVTLQQNCHTQENSFEQTSNINSKESTEMLPSSQIVTTDNIAPHGISDSHRNSSKNVESQSGCNMQSMREYQKQFLPKTVSAHKSSSPVQLFLNELKKDEIYEGIITQVDNYKQFAVVVNDALAKKFYGEAQEILASVPYDVNFHPSVGSLVVAGSSSDTSWYRACVCRIDGENYQVFCIDFGKMETVRVVKPLPAGPLSELPGFAIIAKIHVDVQSQVQKQLQKIIMLDKKILFRVIGKKLKSLKVSLLSNDLTGLVANYILRAWHTSLPLSQDLEITSSGVTQGQVSRVSRDSLLSQ